MTTFLCLAVPPEATNSVKASFSQEVHITSAFNYGIATAAKGKQDSWQAFILQSGSGSSRLVYKHFTGNRHSNDKSKLLVEGIGCLFESSKCSSLSFCYHTFSGAIDGPVQSVGEQVLLGPNIQRFILDLEEDVRYVVKCGQACPVCGYPGLTSGVIEELGMPSVEVCPSCSTQFTGHNNLPTYETLRNQWISLGAPWSSGKEPPPLRWSAVEQLLESNIPLTNEQLESLK